MQVKYVSLYVMLYHGDADSLEMEETYGHSTTTNHQYES